MATKVDSTIIPAKMVCVDDFERYAERTMASSTLGYFQGGVDDEVTLKENVMAFRRYQIVPRMLRATSEYNMETTILGHRIAFPVCVAPTAYQCMAHSEGEIATARATASMKTALALSTLSTASLEDVSQASDGVVQFFQLYIGRDHDAARRLVARAERAGYAAIFLTVDAPVFGKRRAHHYNPATLSAHLQLPNLENTTTERTLVGLVNAYIDPILTWDTLTWVKSITNLPVVVKGILSAEDAVEAVRRGASGVVVSNHGGRQLDTVPAALDVLTDVVRAVAGRCEVYLDGGVRTGTDVFKAIALGAKAVFVGRPVIYGLAYNGEAGVRQVLSILQTEFRQTMQLAGCSTVNEINESFIRRPTHSSLPVSRL